MNYEVASPGPPALGKQQPLEAGMRAMELLPQGELDCTAIPYSTHL